MKKSLYSRRIEAGLCGMCGGKDPGGSLCQACKEKCKQRQAEKRAKRATEGLCPQCGKRKKAKGKARCKECLAYSAEKRNGQSRRWRMAGLCQCCGAEPIPGKTVCQKCSKRLTETSKVRREDFKKRGLCWQCGAQPRPGRTLCQKCRDRVNAYHERLRLVALVAYSGSPPKCACCGNDDLRVLDIDHVRGDGAVHRRSMNVSKATGKPYRSGGYTIHLWLKNNGYPSGFQVLCSNCHRKKTHADRKHSTT